MKIAVRLDDITPDMDWERFLEFKNLLDKYQIKPLIGVVPDNRDENLHKDDDRKDFWEYVKELQMLGWVVAMHGYAHVYTTDKGGMFPLNHLSEYAGLDYEKQLQMILDGKRKITVVASGTEGVMLAIDAPREVSVLREELVEAATANKEATVKKEQVQHFKEILKKKEVEKEYGSDK